jgi:type II secretory ATPase GspE/PulE/Tfp pilus assembly ATPase PilB-like protein
MVGERIHVGELRMTAIKVGLKKFRRRGAMKVAAGETRIAEVLRVAPYSGAG